MGNIWKVLSFTRYFVLCTGDIKAVCLPQSDRTTRSRPRKLESPFIRVQVLRQCIPADHVYCFSAWLRLPDHFNSVVLTQQQMSPSIIAGHNGSVLFKDTAEGV